MTSSPGTGMSAASSQGLPAIQHDLEGRYNVRPIDIWALGVSISAKLLAPCARTCIQIDHHSQSVDCMQLQRGRSTRTFLRLPSARQPLASSPFCAVTYPFTSTPQRVVDLICFHHGAPPFRLLSTMLSKATAIIAAEEIAPASCRTSLSFQNSPFKAARSVAVLMRDQFSVQLWSPPIQEALAAPCCKVTMVMDQLQRYPRTRAFRLGRDASLVLTEPNAGGQSVVSEALSMEYMHQLFGAVDVVTEMQIEYWSPNWKKVDYLCTIYAERIAVSVTRAMKFKAWEAFTLDDARTLLRKKLFGLVVAKTGVSESQRYTKSILHIWCQSKAIADTIALSYKAIVAELEIEDNVILMATVAHEDGIYDNNMTLVQAAA
ncbi:Aste57867_92 [Aphanomyces stellatus]|uniref:Aste57867_92 protein n=1 Tax=Aphanomyces stellatus TaxID=120398 RepID=A0A485K2V1_9STRA|nr:hypothetical protein As57867_000092 [Aphanomyces stellatus]VFT77318.1 Aste57867_92 [Aphanomyces stellatus]